MVSDPVRKAVFLDRDGVINEETGYLHRVEDFQLIPGAPAAIQLLKDAGFLVVVVTNQSGVARGYYPLSAVHALHRHLDATLTAHGTSVDGYYICPHHPEHGIGEYRMACSCRKPFPGMLQKAAADLKIDLAASYMVGDHVSDVIAGRAAGCHALLVMTGHGRHHAEQPPPDVCIVEDILAAAKLIIRQQCCPGRPIDCV
jgi:D-glycero-D-manno-heptose 1,7-bisphosphate phosphatase